MTDTYQSTGYRFVAVLNKKHETGRLMNALGHMTAGLIKLHSEDLDKLRIESYFDKDGGEHANISDHPYIVLKADNSNKIRSLRNELLSRQIPCTDFTNTMIEGSSEQQREGTRNTHEADLDYIGICFFADNETARELTKKFSIFN